MHYLWFDTETGGLNYKVNPLLTAYFGIFDKDLKMIDEIYLQLKPSDKFKLNIEEGAMAVNKINLSEHLESPDTLTYKEGADKLIEFLNKNKIKRKRKSFIPCGHNIGFDKEFIWEQLLDKDTWDKLIHHKTLDTLYICTFLKDVGILPEDVGTLTSLVNYFNIPMGDAHNARGDVLMNVEVYKAIKNLMKNKKDGFSGAMESSLLKVIER